MTTGIRSDAAGYSALQHEGVDKVIFGANGIDYLGTLSASVAASALTLGLDKAGLRFRSATLTSGTVNYRTALSALSLVVPSGATLGTVNATQSRLALLLLDNAGTLELAVVNIAGGNDLSETGVISTTAISAGATSANVIYSTTARTSVPYRVIGYIESTQATAGTWAAAPSTIQGAGGNVTFSMGAVGVGQTFQNVSGSRVSATTYYNTTGRPIFVQAGSTSNIVVTPTVGGVTGAGQNQNCSFIVPPGMSYSVVIGSGTICWSELR